MRSNPLYRYERCTRMEYAKEYDSRTRSSTYRAKRVIRDGRDIKIGEEGKTGKGEREKKERERSCARSKRIGTRDGSRKPGIRR